MFIKSTGFVKIKCVSRICTVKTVKTSHFLHTFTSKVEREGRCPIGPTWPKNFLGERAICSYGCVSTSPPTTVSISYIFISFHTFSYYLINYRASYLLWPRYSHKMNQSKAGCGPVWKFQSSDCHKSVLDWFLSVLRLSRSSHASHLHSLSRVTRVTCREGIIDSEPQ